MKWTLGGSGSSMRVWTDHPSFNPAPTFNERDPSEARFYPLDVGLAVSITRFLSDPLAATVATVVPELVVQLARADQQFPFKEGDPVLIKYWGEDRVVYYWQASVAKFAGQGNLTFSMPGSQWISCFLYPLDQ